MKYIILICILTLTGIAVASPSISGQGNPVAEGEMRDDPGVTAAEPMNGPPAASTKPLLPNLRLQDADRQSRAREHYLSKTRIRVHDTSLTQGEDIRNWESPKEVYLNPEKQENKMTNKVA